MFSINKLFSVFLLALSLSACTGGSSGSDSGSEQNPDSTAQTPEPSTNTPVPDPEQVLLVPVVSHRLQDNRLELSWSESHARQYRILLMQEAQPTQVFLTEQLAYTTEVLNSGSYTVIVEAYNALGSSLFSLPANTEVL